MAEQEGVKIEFMSSNDGVAFGRHCEDTNTVFDRFAEAGAEATATIKALCEVMNVDQGALKEKMVINALRKKSTIGPSFENDALEVIERLIKERNDYKARNDDAVRVNRELSDEYLKCKKERDDLAHKIHRVEHRLEMPHFILGKIEEKRKYTKEDVIKAQIDVMDQAKDTNQKIINILTEDYKK